MVAAVEVASSWLQIALALINVGMVVILAIINKRVNGHVKAHEHAAVATERAEVADHAEGTGHGAA